MRNRTAAFRVHTLIRAIAMQAAPLVTPRALRRPPAIARSARRTLTLDGIYKTFRAGIPGCWASVSVLRGVDLQVRAGEVVGITGEAGEGKSTLLLCAAGIMHPDRGTVIRRDPRTGAVPVPGGYVPDRPYFGRTFTAREALARAKGCDQRRVAELADLLNVSDCMDRPAHELGRGVLQRLALAEAAATGTPLLLLDDTLDCLGALASEVIRELTAGGASVVLATRDADAAAAVAHRTLLLADGALSARGARAAPGSPHRPRRSREWGRIVRGPIVVDP
jgi:ABC-type multidrug transport system ATPase subunit